MARLFQPGARCRRAIDKQGGKVSKSALIGGISGQDGAHLAALLLSKGYTVYGTSRDAELSGLGNLARLGIRDKVTVVSMALNDFRSVLQVLDRLAVDEVYNLAGQSSVGLSFEQPVETLESIAIGTLNLLEAIRFLKRPIRFYNAGSSECFGDTGLEPATEMTAFRPRSPYAVAKATAFWQVANYREAYGMFACSGILFNHESALRPLRFVTQKIAAGVAEIAAGKRETLELGSLNVARDWGWAAEYVEAMFLMLQQDVPDDFVIATGETTTLEDYVAASFKAADLDWRDHVRHNDAFVRPSDIAISRADPHKAAQHLGWRAQTRMKQVASLMVQAAMDRPARP
jgi:GDPmannose 4,6-dehydratase